MVEPNAAAAAADAPKSKHSHVYLKLVGEQHYKGTDPEDGTFLNMIRGDVARMSAAKAEQVQRDFPKDFKTATEAEFKRNEDDRSKRAADLAKELKEREKRNAVDDRQRAIDHDDDGDDES